MKNIIKYTIAVLTIASVFTARAEREYQSICQENRIWIYSEFYRFRNRPLQHKIILTKGTTEINGKTYSNCYAYDYDNINASLCLVAYIRQQDGRVYMLRSKESYTPNYPLMLPYGFYDNELLIYDFTLSAADEFQVGIDEYYEDNYNYDGGGKLSDFLFTATDVGRIKCESESSTLLRNTEVRKFEMKFIAPTADSSNFSFYKLFCGNQVFSIQEGIGLLSHTNSYDICCPQGYFPFPYTCNITDSPPICIDLLYVCDDGDFNKVIYRQDGLPENPKEYFDALAVEEIVADGDAEPEYYNLQGQKVAAPEVGSIYIVKRGSKTSKEVYRR